MKLQDSNQPDEEAAAAAMIMLAYDDEFLYVASSCPRYPGAPATSPVPADRQHDADIVAHERLAIALDIDRDYSTWYELQADIRGETHDRCWNDAGWDPQWYVAAQADDSHWRLEIAIPWSEMVATAPQPREAWGLSLTRLIPAQAVQTWAGHAHASPRWENFGLIRFE